MKGNGRVFQRGQVWWIAYYDNGQEHRESSGSRDRKEAVKLLQAAPRWRWPRVWFMPVRRSGSATRVVRMQDLFDLVEHSFQLNNRTSPVEPGRCLLPDAKAFWQVHGPGLYRLWSISHYMAARQRAGRKPATINREISVLKVAFRLGYQHDLVTEECRSSRICRTWGCATSFSPARKIDALLPRLPDHLRDVVLFGFLTGWRKGEIIGFEVEQRGPFPARLSSGWSRRRTRGATVRVSGAARRTGSAD